MGKRTRRTKREGRGVQGDSKPFSHMSIDDSSKPPPGRPCLCAPSRIPRASGAKTGEDEEKAVGRVGLMCVAAKDEDGVAHDMAAAMKRRVDITQLEGYCIPTNSAQAQATAEWIPRSLQQEDSG
jgi:hypothetical protein